MSFWEYAFHHHVTRENHATIISNIDIHTRILQTWCQCTLAFRHFDKLARQVVFPVSVLCRIFHHFSPLWVHRECITDVSNTTITECERNWGESVDFERNCCREKIVGHCRIFHIFFICVCTYPKERPSWTPSKDSLSSVCCARQWQATLISMTGIGKLIVEGRIIIDFSPLCPYVQLVLWPDVTSRSWGEAEQAWRNRCLSDTRLNIYYWWLRTVCQVSYSPALCARSNSIPIYREDCKVSHYIINKIIQNGQTVYRIGDQCFPDLPELLAFYKLHYLDTTPLRCPLPKDVEVVVGKFDFDGSVSWSSLWVTSFFHSINIYPNTESNYRSSFNPKKTKIFVFFESNSNPKLR